jgi:hypothetical protein
MAKNIPSLRDVWRRGQDSNLRHCLRSVTVLRPLLSTAQPPLRGNMGSPITTQAGEQLDKRKIQEKASTISLKSNRYFPCLPTGKYRIQNEAAQHFYCDAFAFAGGIAWRLDPHAPRGGEARSMPARLTSR